MLARDIVAFTSEASEADSAIVHTVKLCQSEIEIVVQRGPFLWQQCRERSIHENPARHKIHHIERRADDGVIFTEQSDIRNRNVGWPKRLHGGEFAIDLMGARQQRTGRLLAHDKTPNVGAIPGHKKKRRIGCTALELKHAQRRPEGSDARAQIGVEAGNVEAVLLCDVADGQACSRIAHGVLTRHRAVVLRRQYARAIRV